MTNGWQRYGRKVLSLASVLATLAFVSIAVAAGGALDPSFDGDGRVVTDVPGSYEAALAIAIHGNGKIVAAGVIGTGLGRDFMLNRYAPDGTLDATFGGDGRVTTDFAGTVDLVRAVLTQPDGKVVAAGATYTVAGGADFALTRYNLDGSLDTTFGGDGKVSTDVGGHDSATALTIQPDGKILVAGGTTGVVAGFWSHNFALARFLQDGTLDTSFDGDGMTMTDFAGHLDHAHGVVLQPDGKIVVAGEAVTGSPLSHQFALARYSSAGSLDPTFGGDGKVVTDFLGDNETATAVALQPGGDIVASGVTALAGANDFALARYEGDGELDPTFSGDGKVVTDFAGGHDEAHGMAVQADGGIVAAGVTVTVAGPDFALTRYTSDGSLDVGFDGDGKLVTDFGGTRDFALGVAPQGDGRIVAAGYSTAADRSTDSYNVALARYLPGDATAPTVDSITLSANPIPVGSFSTLQLTASDNVGVTGGEYTIDGGTPQALSATLSATLSGLATGVYTIEARVRDAAGNWSAAAALILAVYDPSGGFVTGAGMIDSPAGAYAADPALAGRARFGFVSQYKKGANVPTGKTDFEFKLARFEFESTSYQWLVVSGPKAQYKGTGTVNGAGSYGFLLTATDGQLAGGGGTDKFRIKIWELATGAVVYDNVPAGSDDLDQASPQAIVAGSIVIHK